MSKESSKTSVEVKADVERYKIMLYTLNEAINRLAGLPQITSSTTLPSLIF